MANAEATQIHGMANPEATGIKERLHTIFPPQTMQPELAVLMLPGGGYRTVTIDCEGIDVTKWISEKLGCLTFAFEYSLGPTGFSGIAQNVDGAYDQGGPQGLG
eukprot:16441482-Heterocapsa_arctica.AAC.1